MTHVAALFPRLVAWLRSSRSGLPGLGLLLTLGVLLPACADPPTATESPVLVKVEPGSLTFHPDTRSIEVTVTNTADKQIIMGVPRVTSGDHDDWTAFRLSDDATSAPIGAGQSVSFDVAVDAGYFLGPGPDAPPVEDEADSIAPDQFRPGQARLSFNVNGEPFAGVPIRFVDPPWWSQYLLPSLLKIVLLVLAFIMPLASLLTWMERKQSAMMQDRVGPNMANLRLGPLNLRLWGIPHFIADGVKMLFKEDFIPKRAHRQLYALAPLFAFIPALVVFAIVPFGDALCYEHMFEALSQADVDQCADGRGGTPLQIAQIDVGLLYYFAIASLATYGTALAGWSSYNKWAILGSLRASAQMISYEVAIGLTIVGALLVYGTLEPHALVRAQMETYWGIALQPIAFVLFFIAAMAETKRAPFDLPEGESEIIGYFIEYSGMRFGLFFLGEFIEVIFMSAMVATLFLGGWSLPFGMLGAQGFSSPLMAQLFLSGVGVGLTVMGVLAWRTSKAGELFGAVVAMVGLLHLFAASWSLFTGWGTEVPHILVVLLGMAVWGGKVFLLCGIQLLIRWTLPRFRYDQLMSVGWKGLLPLSIANIVLTAILVYLLMPGANPAS